MGKAVAAQFGREGYYVILVGRNASRLEETAAEMTAQGSDAEIFPGDVGSVSDMQALARKARAAGEIGVVVNAAGMLASEDRMRSLYRTNILGTVNVAEAFFPLMGPGSVMILFASMAGRFAPMDPETEALFLKTEEPDFLDACVAKSDNGQTAYSISKRFVLEYTKENCFRFGEKGIRIVSISPGAIQTPMMEKASEIAGEAFVRDSVEGTALKRIGAPEEVADLASFLAGEKAAYITGTDILIDGGLLVGMHRKGKE